MTISVELLRSIPYFADLTSLQLQQVQRQVRERSFDKREIIFYEGELRQGLYIVISGMVRIYKTSVEGKEQVLLIANPGDSFNDVPVFDEGPNPATAEALASSIIGILPKSAVLALLREFPSVAVAVLRVFAARLRHLTLLAEDLSSKRVVGRVAKILLEYAESGTSSPRSSLTQQQMAAMVGTAREMVGRAIKRLEKEGAIKRERHRIIVVKPDVLRDMS